MKLIQHEERAKQLLDFTGLMEGKCYPSDLDGIQCFPCGIDGVYDYHDKAWIFFELKLGDKKLGLGQTILLERLVKDISCSGKPSIALILEHDIYDTTKNVLVKDSIVREFYCSNKKIWKPMKHKCTAKTFIPQFLKLISR